MGMAASQARLLSLTSRMSDLEYAAQNISNTKMALSRDTEDVSKKYMSALNKEQLTVHNPETDKYVDATAYNLTTYGAVSEDDPKQRILKSANGEILVSSDIAAAYNASNHDSEAFVNAMGYTSYNTSDEALSGTAGTAYQTTKAAANAIMSQIDSYNATYAVYTAENQANGYAKSDKNNAANSLNEINNYISDVTPPEGIYYMTTELREQIEDAIAGTLANATKSYNAIKANAERAKTAADIIEQNGGTAAQISSADNNATWADYYLNGTTNLNRTDTDIESAELIYKKVCDLIELAQSGKDKPASNCLAALELCKTLASYAGYAAGDAETNTSNAAALLNKNTVEPAKTQVAAVTKAYSPVLSDSLTTLDEYYTSDVLTSHIKTISDAKFSSSWVQTISGELTSLLADMDTKIASSSTYSPDLKVDKAFTSYYLNLFSELEECGCVTQSDKNMNDTDWLSEQLANGNLSLAEWDSDGGDDKIGDFISTSWKSGDETLVTEDDETEIAKAKAEYDAANNEISTKEKKIDMKLKSIDTEHSSIQTEMESVQKVLDKNMERSFKQFDA